MPLGVGEGGARRGEAEVPLSGTCEGGRARRPPAPPGCKAVLLPHRPVGAVARAALPRLSAPLQNETKSTSSKYAGGVPSGCLCARFAVRIFEIFLNSSQR